MKLKFILFIFLSFAGILYSQNFSGKSDKVILNIKVPPPDDIKPIITLSLPPMLPDYPISCRDSFYTIRGTLYDNSEKAKIFIDNEFKGIVLNGAFKYDVKLKAGLNQIILEARDKRENFIRDTLKLFQDPLADLTPPIIKILEPVTLVERGIKVVRKFENQDSVLRIQGKISDENQILGVWINSDIVDSVYDDLFTYTLFYPFPDTVQIMSADISGNLTTEVYEVRKNTSDEQNQINNIQFHALIITVEDYKDPGISPLDHPVKNGEDLIKILTTQYTFDEKNILHLKNPTRAMIISGFQNIRKKLGENDNLLIFYAGHGFLDETIDQGYWFPLDAKADDQSNWISNSNIKEFIKGIQTNHTLLIADACFAGNFLRSVDNNAITEKSFFQTYRSKSRRVITSGTHKNSVPDKSVFMKYLLKRLADNQERFLSSEVLLLSIKEQVRLNSPIQQVPQYGIILETNDEGFGDFQFIRK